MKAPESDSAKRREEFKVSSKEQLAPFTVIIWGRSIPGYRTSLMIDGRRLMEMDESC